MTSPKLSERLERLREFYGVVWQYITLSTALDYARNCLRNFEAEVIGELTDEKFEELLKLLWSNVKKDWKCRVD